MKKQIEVNVEDKARLLSQKETLENLIAQLIKKEQLSGEEFDGNFLKGQICLKKIRCGKKNCHCCVGLKENVGHGPYPHLQWYKDKKIKTKYLNKQKYPVYEKILHWQQNLKSVDTKLKLIDKKIIKDNKDKHKK